MKTLTAAEIKAATRQELLFIEWSECCYDDETRKAADAELSARGIEERYA